MHENSCENFFWNSIAIKCSSKPCLTKIFNEYKSNEFKRLLNKWIGETVNLKILKTDLFEEAINSDSLLFNNFINDKIFGLDISNFIIAKADITGKRFKRNCYFTTGDVRNLPYKNESFDVIVSNSTLDHLRKEEIRKAILELKRVLKVNGRIILIINNKHNFIFYIMSRIGIFLNIIPFPVEFYTIEEMKKIFSKNNLKIEQTTAIVHLISPVNRILLIFYYILGQRMVNSIAKFFVFLAEKLKGKKTKFLTGWFLAFLITNNTT